MEDKNKVVTHLVSKYMDTYYSELEVINSKKSKQRILYKRNEDELPLFSVEFNIMHINPIVVDQISTAFSIQTKQCVTNLSEWATTKHNLGSVKPNLLVRESKCGCKASIKSKLV